MVFNWGVGNAAVVDPLQGPAFSDVLKPACTACFNRIRSISNRHFRGMDGTNPPQTDGKMPTAGYPKTEENGLVVQCNQPGISSRKVEKPLIVTGFFPLE